MNDNLRNYPLPDRIVAELHRADRLAAWLDMHGHPAPSEIDVDKSAMAHIHAIVHKLSHGCMGAQSVHWNGRHITSLAA